MSKKVTENTEEKQEKVMTRYDRKMQEREAAKKKAEKEDRISKITGIVIVAALFCLVASFPIRSYMTINGTYIEVAGEKVSRVEFDYNYNLMKNNYLSQYSYYLSMFGIDLSGDLSTQMYSDTLSWQDYFEQMAAENIAANKALRDQAKAAGFTYDATEEYAKYEETLKTAAEEAGMTEKAYIQQTYGTYATASRIKGYIKEAMEISAFYDQVSEEKAPTEEEIQSYYEENKNNYDSVDYRLVTVNAELPTEPTELADPVEETDSTDDTTSTDTEDKAYEPSEAEIEFAMRQAHDKAEEALATVATEGDLHENAKSSEVQSLMRDWLFDSERKAGDSTVIENSSSNLYYVLEFEDRYLDQAPTIDARIITLNQDSTADANALLEDWKNGAATEDSFAELADNQGASAEGGLYEGLTSTSMDANLSAWLFDSARAAGDTTAIVGGEGANSYVVYYVGTNQPEWSQKIKSTLLSTTMSEYLDEISKDYPVEDPKGNLNYLKVQAAESAAAESASEESSTSADETTDSSDASTDSSTQE